MYAETATFLYYSIQDISGKISWGTGGELTVGKEQTPAGHTLQAKQMERWCLLKYTTEASKNSTA